jgi:hypothetical protein
MALTVQVFLNCLILKMEALRSSEICGPDIISQKTRIFVNTAVRSSNIAYDKIVQATMQTFP